jgi:pimeloyl-ACP methyl ester carboxylesterase
MNEIRLSAGPIAYEDIGAGEVIVLLHGLHMNGSLWREVVPVLAVGHRCVVPTLPFGGHRTPMHAEADLTPRGVARLVGEFLQHLDLHDVTLVGNDTGGVIAQLLVTEDPRRIGRLVLASCEAFDNFPPGLPGKVSAVAARMPGGLYWAGQSMRWRPLTRLPLTWGWMSKRAIPRDLLDSWFGPLREQRAVRRDVVKFVRAVDNAELIEAAEKLADFDRPALVAWAVEDKVMPPAHADQLATRLPSGRRVDIEDSFTLIPLDQPNRLADLIAAFIRDTAGRG